jgi:hypothetical protein
LVVDATGDAGEKAAAVGAATMAAAKATEAMEIFMLIIL